MNPNRYPNGKTYRDGARYKDNSWIGWVAGAAAAVGIAALITTSDGCNDTIVVEDGAMMVNGNVNVKGNNNRVNYVEGCDTCYGAFNKNGNVYNKNGGVIYVHGKNTHTTDTVLVDKNYSLKKSNRTDCRSRQADRDELKSKNLGYN